MKRLLFICLFVIIIGSLRAQGFMATAYSGFGYSILTEANINGVSVPLGVEADIRLNETKHLGLSYRASIVPLKKTFSLGAARLNSQSIGMHYKSIAQSGFIFLYGIGIGFNTYEEAFYSGGGGEISYNTLTSSTGFGVNISITDDFTIPILFRVDGGIPLESNFVFKPFLLEPRVTIGLSKFFEF